MQEVADHVEDRAVQHHEAGLDGLVADGLHQNDSCRRPAVPASSTSRRFADEAARRQVEDLLLLDRRVEGPVEVVQGFQLAEASGLDAPVQLPLAAHDQFVLQDQFQELGVVEMVAGRFLQAHVQAFQQPGQAQLLQGLGQRFVHREDS